MKPTIRVESLGKCYRVDRGSRRSGYRTLRESLVEAASAPLRRWRAGAAAGRGEPFWALDDVSFEVRPGEVMGVIGRNGAGKSTLLKILSRITKPTTGTVQLRGRVGSLLEVGTGFHPELTGRENIYLSGAILGMSRAEIARKFDRIVAFAEVERFLDTPVKRYSSGMYVRLAFAVAANMETEILLVDEVLAVGDAAFQKKCLGKMGDVAREGRTVLFVSHNLGAMTGLCETGTWLDGGRLKATGDIRSIVNRYVSDTVDRSADVMDLREARREGDFGTMGRIATVEVVSGLPLRHGEPAVFRISLEARAEIEGVSVGLGFSTPEGTRLLTYDSDYGAERHGSAKGRLVQVLLEVDRLPLSPGLYTLDVGSRSGGHHALDYLPSFAQIEVAPGPRTPGHIIGHIVGVRLPAKWDWDLSSSISQTGGNGS
jgi:lipopolysaccharide transport system ATP-binding protein